MALEKQTQLASIEIIFPSRAINAAWHTNIVEDGEIISGPSIHRRAFSVEELSDIQDDIQRIINKLEFRGGE